MTDPGVNPSQEPDPASSEGELSQDELETVAGGYSNDPLVRTACYNCSGSGKCWNCSGTGYGTSGAPCTQCSGTGRCYYCGGQGYR